MRTKPSGQDLIDAFFGTLEGRKLDQCESLLEQLQSLSQEQPAFAPWCTYLEGILANERDRDWAKAERIFSHLLIEDLDPALHVRVLLALGRTYDYLGRWQQAIDAYERSLPLFMEVGQPLDRAKALKNIAIACEKGFAHGDLGHESLEYAEYCCRRSLEMLQASSESTRGLRWLEATTWNMLGLVYKHLQRWDEAIQSYQRRLEFGLELKDRFGIGVAHGNLGEIHQLLGPYHWPQALAAYREARTIFGEFGDTYEEVEVLANLASLHQDMGNPSMALDYYEQAIHLIEALRAGISSEAARAGFFATIVETYANTVLLCLEASREELAFNYVERARSRAFLDMLAAGSSDLARETEATTMTLPEVQAPMPPDVLLIEYFTTGLVEATADRVPTRPAVQRHRFPPARTLIFVVTHDGIQVHDAGLSPNDLRPRQLGSVVERHFLQPQIRRRLYDMLISPVEGLLRGKRRLYLVPHGPLHYIPFQALIAPDGDTLLREEGPQLIYAPSATLLFHHGRAEPSQASASCLALGYNSEGATRLRFAEDEARSVARLTGGQALVGPSPKKARLYSQAADYRLLHLSCHGEFEPESPLASALQLAPGESLTALEVLEHLRLHCDLVTLSACESGLSRVRRGDELVGLIRAFMYVGVPALIATLWRVDERSTRIVMEKFYQEIQNGAGFSEALKRAQLYAKNLTRREALEVLGRSMTDETPDSSTPPGAGRSDSPATVAALQHVRTYLKGLDSEGAIRIAATLMGSKDDEKIFADPYYWAPFIFVGDHRSGV
jgi:CHAT domain-containing protein/tetratricopeptide (TPR) repeat protein